MLRNHAMVNLRAHALVYSKAVYSKAISRTGRGMTGLAGTVISALRCFTPVLVFVLSAVGLSAIVG